MILREKRQIISEHLTPAELLERLELDWGDELWDLTFDDILIEYSKETDEILEDFT